MTRSCAFPSAAGTPGTSGRCSALTGSDCLNVRQDPSATATTRGCFKGGVLLADRGQTTVAGGITWVAVTTPLSDSGWASTEFLER